MKVMVSMLLILATHYAVDAQVLSPSVISSQGNFSSNGNISLSTTVGEVFTSFFSGSSSVLSQGFHQPDLLVITGEWAMATKDISLRIFPNPTGGIINIHVSGEGSFMSHLSVMDITGKMLRKEAVLVNSNLQIDLSEYAQGSYILSFTNDEGKLISSHKILKLH
jgi:hypothetical protein